LVKLSNGWVSRKSFFEVFYNPAYAQQISAKESRAHQTRNRPGGGQLCRME